MLRCVLGTDVEDLTRHATVVKAWLQSKCCSCRPKANSSIESPCWGWLCWVEKGLHQQQNSTGGTRHYPSTPAPHHWPLQIFPKLWARARKVSEAWYWKKIKRLIIRWKLLVSLDLLIYLESTFFLKTTRFCFRNLALLTGTRQWAKKGQKYWSKANKYNRERGEKLRPFHPLPSHLQRCLLPQVVRNSPCHKSRLWGGAQIPYISVSAYMAAKTSPTFWFLKMMLLYLKDVNNSRKAGNVYRWQRKQFVWLDSAFSFQLGPELNEQVSRFHPAEIKRATDMLKVKQDTSIFKGLSKEIICSRFGLFWNIIRKTEV